MAIRDSHDDAKGRQALATQRLLFDTRNEVKEAEEALAERIAVTRTRWVAVVTGGLALISGGCGTILVEQSTAFRVAIVTSAILLLLALAATGLAIWFGWDLESRRKLEADLDEKREALRRLNAHEYPSLSERRLLYREDVGGIIEQYQRESRTYRRIHNSLQSLIMVGSASTTTVAALDTAGRLTWQNIVIVALSFAITLAATFTGYYKFRERSYFLQQTADSIEEETNAFALGVGEYFEMEDSDGLALFTSRVEGLRNEQRRRQQQLDQPTDYAAPTSQPVV